MIQWKRWRMASTGPGLRILVLPIMECAPSQLCQAGGGSVTIYLYILGGLA